ncbi:MAG: endo-1,4-beta-xylanase [Spirochaetes bacterium]|nr:endo-1,4-beta-xylanase [Spirochaetota bacterium]
MRKSFVFAALILSALWVSAIDEFNKTEGLMRYYCPGVIRAEEGTIEFTVAIDKPISEFGCDWQFMFQVVPSRKIGQGANTLIGVFMPPSPEKPELAFLIRNGKDYYRVNVANFSYTPGQKMNLAFSWGKALVVYINGVKRGSTPMPRPLDDNYFPHEFSVSRTHPYLTDAMKVSTKALTERDLSANPSEEFTADSDTSFLAVKGLSVMKKNTSSWHKQGSYASLTPMYRPELQCFIEGETVSLPFVSINYERAPKTYTVNIAAKDVKSNTVCTRTETISVPNDGTYRTHTLAVPELSKLNFYMLETTTVSAAGEQHVYPSSLSVMPKADAAKDGTLARYYQQHQDWKLDPAMYTKMGVTSTRAWAGGNVFLWNVIEPEKGHFTWDRADGYVAMCRAAGLDILGVLGYPSRWASEEPDEAHKKKHPLAQKPDRWKPKNIDDWGRYVYETVKHYKDVEYWEIYNEINFCPPGLPATFSGSTEEYLELLKVAYTQAKKANPACKVLISGFSADVNKEMPLALLKLGAADYCDIFNVHGYSGVEGGAAWISELKKRKPAMPYWMTEQMWFQLDDMIKRMFLTVAYYVEFIEAGYARYYNMGTEEVFFDRYTYSPTRDYHVTAVFNSAIRSCNALGGKYKFPKSDSMSLRHYFKRTDGTILSIIGAETGAYEIVFSGDVSSARDVMGQPIPVTVKDGANSMVIPDIAYIESKAPIVISEATAKTKLALYANGSFEDIEGDVGMGGLKAGKARTWMYRDKTFDPEGVVMLSDNAHTGKYAYAVTSGGKGRVYAFQYTKTFAPGKYVVSAYIKKTAGDSSVKPYFFWYNIDNGKIENKMFDDVTDDYRQYRFEFELAKVDKLAIGVGINAGAGSIVIDDVVFESVE